MKLQEKILYSRKKAGLSQEALAEQLGVSRQAISKWETGDAVPEITKIVALAKAFGVTTDWLLSEEDQSETETKEHANHFHQRYETASSWVDALPGFIKKMIQAYGWLFGVYLAVVGTGFTVLGGLAKYLVKKMFSPVISDPFGNMFDLPFESIVANNPVSTMGSFMMGIGIIFIIAGVVIAVILKKRSNESLI